MKKRFLNILFLFISIFPAFSQTLVGNYHQEFFSGRLSHDPGVYTVATLAHKKGAVLIRIHGSTAIERIYIVVEKIDLPAFVNALESVRVQYMAKGSIENNYFPPVSIMWRDRHRHIWIESNGYQLNPEVRHHNKKTYLYFSDNVSNNFIPENKSGDFFLLFDGPKEIEGLLQVLRSDKLRSSLARCPVVLRPFEESRDY